MGVVRFTVVRLPFLIERLTHAVAKDDVRGYQQRSFHVAKFANFVRRRIGRHALRLHALSLMGQRANAYSLRSRIGVSRIVFLYRFPVK